MTIDQLKDLAPWVIPPLGALAAIFHSAAKKLVAGVAELKEQVIILNANLGSALKSQDRLEEEVKDFRPWVEEEIEDLRTRFEAENKLLRGRSHYVLNKLTALRMRVEMAGVVEMKDGPWNVSEADACQTE